MNKEIVEKKLLPREVDLLIFIDYIYNFRIFIILFSIIFFSISFFYYLNSNYAYSHSYLIKLSKSPIKEDKISNQFFDNITLADNMLSNIEQISLIDKENETYKKIYGIYGDDTEQLINGVNINSEESNINSNTIINIKSDKYDDLGNFVFMIFDYAEQKTLKFLAETLEDELFIINRKKIITDQYFDEELIKNDIYYKLKEKFTIDDSDFSNGLKLGGDFVDNISLNFALKRFVMEEAIQELEYSIGELKILNQQYKPLYLIAQPVIKEKEMSLSDTLKYSIFACLFSIFLSILFGLFLDYKKYRA